jgi:acetyltransferase-like isoleucine patch superfamily enzyme
MKYIFFLIRAFIRIKGIAALLCYTAVYRNLVVGKNVIYKGIPIIHLFNDSEIVLEDGVLLNSSNFGYHINMFKGVKLLADGKNAKILIGKNTRIHGSCIHAQKLIRIGKNCLIAANCQVMDSNSHQLEMMNAANRINTIDKPREIEIGSNVWIGTGVVILPGTNIGDGSVIAANSVVKGNVPAKCLFGGNPAKLIKKY